MSASQKGNCYILIIILDKRHVFLIYNKFTNCILLVPVEIIPFLSYINVPLEIMGCYFI